MTVLNQFEAEVAKSALVQSGRRQGGEFNSRLQLAKINLLIEA